LLEDSRKLTAMNSKEQHFTARDRDFNDICFLAATICQVPLCLLSIETGGAAYTRSVYLREGSQMISEAELAAFLDLSDSDLTLIPDARVHAVLGTNGTQRGGMTYVFYAAITLRTPSDGTLVRLAVLDQEGRHLDHSQVESLNRLAGQVVHLLELTEKENQLRQLEEIHRETKQRLHKVIDAAEVGIWEICIDTDEFRYSERWAQIFGYDSKELGKITRAQSSAFVHPGDFAESTKAMEDYRSGILPRYECELRMKHKKGYWVWVLARGQYVTDEGEYQGKWIVGTIKDTSEQIVANEQIYVREKRFQILLENSEDAITILNEEGRPNFETESVSKILGYDTRRSFTEPIRNLVHPDDLEGFDRWFQKSLETPGLPVRGNISRMRHFDGSWRHISGTLTNLLGDPIIKGLINNFKDVSAEVITEQLRQKTERRYRILAQEGADLVCVVDRNGVFNYLSPNYQAHLGFAKEELLGKNAFQFIHDDDVPQLKSKFSQLREKKKVRTSPYRFKHSDLGWTWIQSVATNLLHDPDIQGVVVNSVDVSEVVEAQQALEQSIERFELVLKAGSETIYEYDPLTQDVFLSETYEETFGILKDGIKSGYNMIYERIHPEDLDRSLAEFRAAMDNPEVSIWTREYRLLKGDGSYAHVRDRSIKVTDDTGKPTRVVGALMDISHISFFQKLLEIEKTFIERSLVRGTQENDLYRQYLRDIESLIPGMRSSLSRVVGGKITQTISPSLPEELIEIIQRITIGPLEASCGTAAYLNEKVLVTDVFKDPRWENYIDVAKTFGIGACWSFPINDSEGNVVATVANYYSYPKEVEGDELQALERAHRLISLLMAQYDHLEKIRLSNERYEMVTRTTNEAIFDWDVQRDRFHWGESLQRVFGHEFGADEFDLNKWVSLTHPADDLENVDRWNRFMQDPSAHKWQNEFRFLRKDGTFAFVQESANLIRDEHGKPVRMIGVLRDQTEMKKMEILLASASKLSRVGGWELDILHNRLVWSPTICEIHEVPIGFTGSRMDGIKSYREDYQDRVASAVRLAIEKGEKFDLEAPIITATGKERWVRSIGEPEYLDGECIRIFGSVQDIQERKLMEERLKGVSDSIPGVIFQYVLEPDGSEEFRYVSKGSIPLLGLTPEECMADSQLVWSQIAQGGEMELVKKSLEDSANTLNSWNFEWRVLSPPGKIRWREGLGKPNRKGDGSIVWDALIMDVTERKNLENFLEQSASMAKIGSWELDLSIHPLWLNCSATTRNILQLGDMGGVELKVVMDRMVGSSRELAQRKIRSLIETGTGFDVELELIAGSGNPIWIRCIGQAYKIKGEILSVVGSIQDIHDRKLSELNLKSLLVERDAILRSIGHGFFAVDRAFVVTYWNQQAENLLHIPKEDILGKNLWSVFKGKQWDEFHRNIKHAMESGQAYHFEDYLEAFQSWFSISAFPSHAGLTVSFRDVTENKNVQEEISESNERFERVSEATNDAIWDYQIQEDKLYWGKGFTTMFGYEPNVIQPTMQFGRDLIHEQDRDRVMSSFAEARDNPEIVYWNEEYRFQKVDGSFAYVMDRVVFSRNSAGQAVRVTGAISDITERREFENSLKKLNANLKRQTKELAISNAELEQFAYVASHDLQEPLRMVSSFLSQLDRKYKDKLDEKAQKYIHFAVDGATRMRQVILDLLEYSRVGKEEHHLEKVNLEEVIYEVTQLQAKLIEEKRARIRFEGHASITCFRSPILQIFQNLIGNALKYSKEGVPPRITVACLEEKNHWLLSVKDNGIGIKEEYFSKIFVIFQRLHAKQEYTGTGLGLAIVKKIVDGLGGKIWLESEYSVGTTFYFTISKSVK
jgi:PAS domain S-box-containing protein